MKKGDFYPPEGTRIQTAANTAALSSLSALYTAMQEGRILEAFANACTTAHELLIPLPKCGCIAVMPREECAIGIDDGSTREIAILSRVGKPVCFQVLEIDDQLSPPRVIVSRRAAQLEAQEWFFQNLHCGDILPVRVTHLESFGAFVDLGCGLPSFIGIENLSISRIFHPSDRVHTGQMIFAVVLQMEQRIHRITLTHRELLGTWQENAALFSAGETVQGIVRSIESYGIFVELTPNLSGLAERRADVHAGQLVSVYIKSILPSRMKIKLNIIDLLDMPPQKPPEPHYFITEGSLTSWVYSPPECDHKFIMTDFSSP